MSANTPKSEAEASQRIDALTDTLSKSWRSAQPEHLDKVAELMGQREALVAIEAIPLERLPAALLARIASRTEQARDTVGAGLVALHAEIAVYVVWLRGQP